MGKLKITPGGGGGVASGDTTVTRDKVPSGLLYLGADTNDDIGVGTMSERAASIITPTTTNQIISAGQRLAGDQTILGDPNLKPENIKEGVLMFGKRGSFEGYVTSPLHLYKNGVWSNMSQIGASGINGAEFVDIGGNLRVGAAISESGKVAKTGARLNSAINLTSYKYIKIYYYHTVINNNRLAAGAWIGVSQSPNIIAPTSMTAYIQSWGSGYIVLDVSHLTGNFWVYFGRYDDFYAMDYLAYCDELYLSNT